MRATLAALVLASRLAAADNSLPSQKLPEPTGAIAGTVVWVGPGNSEAPDDYCFIHWRDVGDREDITGGLANVVVKAVPIDDTTAAWFEAHPANVPRRDADPFEWDPKFIRVGVVAPGVPIRVSAPAPTTLRFFSGDELVATLKVTTEPRTITLLPGKTRIVDDTGHVNWMDATPFPAHVSNGNCRFGFQVPLGMYQLLGWHWRHGERSRLVLADRIRKNGALPPLRLLEFGHAKTK